MSIEQVPDPSSITPGAAIVQTPSGPKPACLPDDDAYFAAQLDAGDGVKAFGPIGQKHYYANLLQSESWPEDGSGISTMHPVDAAIMALFHLVRRMEWRTISMLAMGGEDNEAPRSPAMTRHKLGRVILDWPEWDASDIPVDHAVIMSPEDVRWDPGARSSRLLQNTINVFGEGTMLRHLGEWPDVSLKLVVWFGHKDIRRGFDSRLSSVLAADRTRETWHRTVIVPEYFNRDVKLMMVGRIRPDSPEQAKMNRWPIEYTINAAVEQVELVRVPGYVGKVQVDVETNGLA
jgi:hypothetical protein